MTTISVITADLPELEFVPTEGTDFVIDYRGDVDGQEVWGWTSCGPLFGDSYSNSEIFTSQAAAVKDASDLLADVHNESDDFLDSDVTSTGVDFQLPETSPYQSGVHLSLCTLTGREGIHWQGLCQEAGERERWWGEADFSECSSDQGHFNARYAVADAVYCLHRQRDFSAVDALTLCEKLELPVEQLVADRFIPLTVSQSLSSNSTVNDIEAMSLEAKEEVIINRSEAAAFIAECQGWQSIAFEYEDGTTFTSEQRCREGFGVVLQMDKTDWAKWLAGYEIAEKIDIKMPVASLYS